MDHDGFITPQDLVAASRARGVTSPGSSRRTPTPTTRTTSPGGDSSAADANGRNCSHSHHKQQRQAGCVLVHVPDLSAGRSIFHCFLAYWCQVQPHTDVSVVAGVVLSPSSDDVAAVLHEAVAEVLGGELTLQEATAMLQEVDEKHAGRISLQEVRL